MEEYVVNNQLQKDNISEVSKEELLETNIEKKSIMVLLMRFTAPAG